MTSPPLNILVVHTMILTIPSMGLAWRSCVIPYTHASSNGHGDQRRQSCYKSQMVVSWIVRISCEMYCIESRAPTLSQQSKSCRSNQASTSTRFTVHH